MCVKLASYKKKYIDIDININISYTFRPLYRHRLNLKFEYNCRFCASYMQKVMIYFHIWNMGLSLVIQLSYCHLLRHNAKRVLYI